MTRSKEEARRVAELNCTFMTLNDNGKNSALAILRTLSFAQTVMAADARKKPGNAACRQTG